MSRLMFGIWLNVSVFNYMNLEWYLIDPGGNKTAIVPGSHAKKDRARIAQSIMAANPQIEQVGFWMSPNSSKAYARLEMTGGELCGNALRSLGALLAPGARAKTFRIETNVWPEPFVVRASHENAAVSFPLNVLRLSGSVCHLPGISHVIIPHSGVLQEPRAIMATNKVLSKKAAGVIAYEQEGSMYRIYPSVWVRANQKILNETACASGTMALALFLYGESGKKRFVISQPSGTKFFVSIRGKEMVLSGPVISISRMNLSFK